MISFTKAHACGNDFLIVDEPVESARYAEIARILCARNTGVGADGVEYLSLSGKGEYGIRLFNADGSEAEISGNGTRCVAAFLAQQDEADSIAIRTRAGVRHSRILERDHPRYRIATEMGIPTVSPASITLRDQTPIAGLHVSIGNPHFVIFVEAADFACSGRRWQEIGAEICIHPNFPHGMNVEFVRVTDTYSIEFRIFERGVGPTQSSGTGSSASAAAAMEAKRLPRKLSVTAEGGEQMVEWPDHESSLLLTGPAEIIASGDCFLL